MKSMLLLVVNPLIGLKQLAMHMMHMVGQSVEHLETVSQNIRLTLPPPRMVFSTAHMYRSRWPTRFAFPPTESLFLAEG